MLIYIPPVNGLALKLNFLLLSGMSISILLTLAIFLKKPLKVTDAKNPIKSITSIDVFTIKFN